VAVKLTRQIDSGKLIRCADTGKLLRDITQYYFSRCPGWCCFRDPTPPLWDANKTYQKAGSDVKSDDSCALSTYGVAFYSKTDNNKNHPLPPDVYPWSNAYWQYYVACDGAEDVWDSIPPWGGVFRSPLYYKVTVSYEYKQWYDYIELWDYKWVNQAFNVKGDNCYTQGLYWGNCLWGIWSWDYRRRFYSGGVPYFVEDAGSGDAPFNCGMEMFPVGGGGHQFGFLDIDGTGWDGTKGAIHFHRTNTTSDCYDHDAPALTIQIPVDTCAQKISGSKVIDYTADPIPIYYYSTLLGYVHTTIKATFTWAPTNDVSLFWTAEGPVTEPYPDV